MRLFIMLLFLLNVSTIFADEAPSIHFEKGNFFAVTSQFDQNLLDNFTQKVLNFEDDELLIYFDSPGGSVAALAHMARIMKGSSIKFICVASFAASAAFILFEHCDNRYILSSGMIMSHNWSGSFQDEGPRILTLYNAVQSLVDTLENVIISKLNVDADEYAALINNNMWMPSALAVKYDAVDEIIDNVTCSKSLIRSKVPRKVRHGFFGRARTIYKSGCPLIQKTYTKKDKSNDDFIENNQTLFELAQKDYKLTSANMIYMGSKDQLKR